MPLSLLSLSARYRAYEPVIRVSRTAVRILLSGSKDASPEKTLKALNIPWAAIQIKRLFVFRYIITNIKPAAVAYTT